MKDLNRYFAIVISATLFIIALVTGFAYLLANAMNNDSTIDAVNKPLIISEVIPQDWNVERGVAVVNGKIEYSNAGSSSCPPSIEKASYNTETDTYELFPTEYKNVACTADYRGMKQIIEYEDGTAISDTAQVKVIEPNFD